MGRLTVKRSAELPQIFSPRLQWDFPMWETRDKLNQPHRLGFPKHFVDGTVAVLAKNGGVQLNPGVYAEAPFTAITDTNLVRKVRLGRSEIPIVTGATAVAKDLYQDGRLIVFGGTGAGLSFPVIGNSEGAGGDAADETIIAIGGSLPIELDTTSDVRVVSSRYRNLRQGTGAGELAVGFIPIIIPPNEYFWLIKTGPASGIAGEAITVSTVAQMDLMPGGSGRLMLRNAAADEGSQIIATFADQVSAVAGGHMQIIARIGG